MAPRPPGSPRRSPPTSPTEPAVPASTYGDAYADVYDDWYPPDVELDVCVDRLAAWAADGPVLELGVGTGRLARPLAARGVRVVGLDASLAMLGRLTAAPSRGEAGVRAVCADMAQLPVAPGAGFALVVASRNTLLNLVAPGAVAACLAQVAATLASGGRVATEVLLPAADAPAGPTMALGRLSPASAVLHVVDHRPGDGTVLGQQLELGDDGPRLRPWALRLAEPPDLDAWAAAAGLALEHRWDDWAGGAWSGDARAHVSVWRRE